MKLNCDMGESDNHGGIDNDEAIMPYIDMANIACGFHASNPSIMAKTVALAKANNVSIGAHPSYPDREGFGRRDMEFSSDEIIHMVLYQVGALQSICHAQGTQVDYVKPHGALYNTMMKNTEVLKAILKAIATLPLANSQNKIPLMVLANKQSDEIQSHAKSAGVPLLFEAFCDRAYNDEGNLVSRTLEGATLATDSAIEKQIHDIASKKIISISNNAIDIYADTICVHGDHQHALASVKKVRQIIDQLG